MVDLGGFAPPSRTLFSRLHTAITYSIYLFELFVDLFDTWIASGYYFFVLGSKLFTFLDSGLFTFRLGFELGLFSRLRHWSQDTKTQHPDQSPAHNTRLTEQARRSGLGCLSGFANAFDEIVAKS